MTAKWWLLATILSLPNAAAAAPCERPEGTTGASVAAQADAARLTFLSSLLAKESERARTWTLAWGAAYGVLTVAQLAVMPLSPREEQPDWYWGALSSVVGVAFTVLGPLDVLEAGPVFARRAATVTPDGACALIAEGERLLREGAEQEQGNRAWFLHAGNVLFNVGLGLVLGLGYGRWTSGLVNMGVGTAIGEATIFTSPNHLTAGWQQYRQGSASTVSLHVVPTAGPGLGMVLTF